MALRDVPRGRGGSARQRRELVQAAAYAAFSGKQLPGLYPWYRAAGAGFYSNVITLSNYSARGAAPVGRHRGLAQFGAFDLAGNVKEWVVNATSDAPDARRFVLGGAWTEPSSTFVFPDAADAWTRSPAIGFRCARFDAVPEPRLLGPVGRIGGGRREDPPVNDATFAVFAALHNYDKRELMPVVENVTAAKAVHAPRDDLLHRGIRDRPRAGAPLPAGRGCASAPGRRRRPERECHSGSNRSTSCSIGSTSWCRRDMPSCCPCSTIPWSAVRGAGPGGPQRGAGPPARVVEKSAACARLRGNPFGSRYYPGGLLRHQHGCGVRADTHRRRAANRPAVLLSGGTLGPSAPEVDAWNYAPRVKVPVLMLNGRDDFIYPAATRQIPLFEALGTPAADKRRLEFEGGHVNLMVRVDVIREILQWIDSRLGRQARR